LRGINSVWILSSLAGWQVRFGLICIRRLLGFHTLPESLDGSTEVAAHIAQLLGAENHDDNQQQDEQLPNTNSTQAHEPSP
jgi:hypothetical protein